MSTPVDVFGSYDDRDGEEPKNSLNALAAEFGIIDLKDRELPASP